MILEKGTYWVCLDIGKFRTYCAKENYCFKQRVDSRYSQPVKDLQLHKSNGNTQITFDLTKELKQYRLATVEEIAEYKRRGEPFDVTELSQEPIEQLLTTIL